MKLSRISLALLPLLSLCSVQAAVYSVVEVGKVPELKSTYASAINDAGDTVFNGAIKVVKNDATNTGVTQYQYFNFPLQLDAINFDNDNIKALFTAEQLADVKNGILDVTTLGILLSTNPAAQPTGNAISYVLRGTELANNIKLRDVNAARSNNEYLYDINNAGVAVGQATATFTQQSFTPAATTEKPTPTAEQVWVPELPFQLGVVAIDNEAKPLVPLYSSYGGGYTVAKAINDNGLVAGYGSVGLVAESITNIEKLCTGAAVPVDVCYYNYHTSNARMPAINAYRQELGDFSYTQRGILWPQNGSNAVTPIVLGFLGDKNSQAAHNVDGVKAINYYSQALDVNNSGIAVGLSLYSNSDLYVYQDEIYRTEQATLFVENEALPMVDETEWSSSRALSINNNDIAIGYAVKNINGYARAKLFYYDYNTNKTNYVTGFFASSNTRPSAINDNNQVVGNAEVIIDGTSTRRNHGFMYDIASDKFVDLNTLVGCNLPYQIVDATDINNNGTIVATALVSREKRNIKGDIVVDAKGDPEMESVTTVVTLQPIANGEVESCDSEQPNDYKRKGGSFGGTALIFGSALLWWRRRKM